MSDLTRDIMELADNDITDKVRAHFLRKSIFHVCLVIYTCELPQFSPVKVFVERKNRHKHCWSLLQQLLFCLPWNIYLSQVLLLERRVAELEKESETSVEQHARLRQENLQLVHRANALEEQLKEQELHADEQLQQESRRQKEAVIKLERERGLELENLQAR